MKVVVMVFKVSQVHGVGATPSADFARSLD